MDMFIILILVIVLWVYIDVNIYHTIHFKCMFSIVYCVKNNTKVKVKSLSRVWLFATPWTPGSSVHGIFWSRALEWVAISFSRESSQPRDRTQVSRIVDRRFTVWATYKWHLLYARHSARYCVFNCKKRERLYFHKVCSY